MAGPLLVTLIHHGRELDLDVRSERAVTVGHLVEELIEGASLDRLPPSPSIAVQRTGRTLPRDAPLSQSDLRSGDRIRLSDSSNTTEDTRTEVAALVNVLEGPDAGRSFDLGDGLSDIGRSELCEVRLTDPMASRRHARIRVAAEVRIWDLGATNRVLVNGEQIGAPTAIAEDDVVTIGASKMRIRIQRPEGPRVVGTEVQFNRPPRVFKPFTGAEVKLPTPPEAAPRQHLPMIASVIPLIMGLVMWQVFGSLIFALFMLMSPLMMLGSYYESRKSGRRDHKRRMQDHEVLLNRCVAQLDDLRQEEIDSRHREFPDAANAASFALDLSPRLWERHPDDEDFLVMRIGRAELNSRTTVTLQPGGSRERSDKLAEIPLRYTRIANLPATASLRDIGGLGIAGRAQPAASLVRALLIQLCCLHAPTEVSVAAFLNPATADQWRWLQWLPHVHGSRSRVARSHFGSDKATCDQLAEDLTALLKDRQTTRRSSEREGASATPAVIVLVEDDAPVDRTRLGELLESGPASGIYFIWICPSRRGLPRACGAVVDLADTGDGDCTESTVGFRDSGIEVTGVELETMSAAEAEKSARALAPVTEIGGSVDAAAEVPASASLVHLLGGVEAMDDTDVIRERWTLSEAQLRASGRLRLDAPVGMAAEVPMTIDLRSDGPHALVAGTTGAGKSELLQSLVASLAATHSPQRVTFLLVDYKGGAAFKDCVNLPHTVGLVTDLNTSEVRRALVSLEAELKHREAILNQANAKDLFELEAMAHESTPPSLVLVVDEFAALAREVPEFVDGVVDVALRGRSLGIHLVLATQRPAGVITQQIRANTNLRIALRVADEDDSVDVIGKKAAAYVPGDRPGRAFVRTGAGEPRLFQGAWGGGFTRAASTEPKVTVSRLVFDRSRRLPSSVVRDTTAPSAGPAVEQRTDLDRLVDNVAATADSLHLPEPRRPWHPPLAAVYDIFELPRPSTDEELVFAMADLPRVQSQTTVSFKPDLQGSLLVLGAGGSGKTVLLRTMAAAAAIASSGPLPHVYGLDFAGRGLQMIADLPHVGAVVPGDDHERVVRLLRDLRSRIIDRGHRFAATRSGSLPEFRAAAPANDAEPRVLVLLDGYAAFHSAYERIEGGKWIAELTQLVAEGRQFGIHFVIAAGRRSAFPQALAAAAPGQVVLRLSSADEYAAAGVPNNIVTEESPPGRAVFDKIEVQVAALGNDPSGSAQSAAVARLGESLRGRPGSEAPSVEALPEEVALSTISSPEDGFAVGIRDDDLRSAVVDVEPGGFIVAGPPRSGKTTALDTFVSAAPSCVTKVMVAAWHPSRLTEARPGVSAALGIDESVDMLKGLVEGSDSGVLLVVDDLHDFADSEVDRLVAELLRDSRTRSMMVVASASADRTRRAYDGALREIRGFKSGILLQPDVDMDGDILSVRLPRMANMRFPAGRGYLVRRGTLELCQMAVS